jgi:signal transduction histidine kinase
VRQQSREQAPERFDEIFLESMKMADAELETLKGIIARSSDFAKMRQPRMQAVNVNDVVRSAVKSFETEFHSRGRPPVKPELLLDEYAEKIWADPELLYKGFENVIANSLNAMPMGGTLTIRTAQQNGAVRVEIADTGSGLEGGERAGAAVPYAAKLDGAGLGLATIQTVVSDHGGRISVEAMPGSGTAFRMEFPVAPTSVKAEMETASTRPKLQTEPTPEQSSGTTIKAKPPLARMLDI